jgi:hypothetical protein
MRQMILLVAFMLHVTLLVAVIHKYSSVAIIRILNMAI